MLAEAKRNAEAHETTNIMWQNSGPDISSVEGSFDLIHSVIVFQHIHPFRGMKILRQMIERLADGVFGSLSFLYYRDGSGLVPLRTWLRNYVPGLNGIASLLHGKSFSEPLLEKTAIT